MTNSLVLIDLDSNNPHGFDAWGGTPSSLIGGVVDHAGNAGTTDSGEFWNSGGAAGTYKVLNSTISVQYVWN